jgi:hypothetical protein
MLPVPSRVRGNRSTRLGFAVLLTLFGAYALAFIWRTSFEVNGVRFFCLFEDAMISMRYAKNFARGLGLVWNPGGERVEGFSNPLWVLYMSLFHLFPISPSKISLGIQLSGALFLLFTLVYVRKLTSLLMPGSRLAQFSAVLLTAFYVPLLNWGLQGMEVSLLALIVCSATWTALGRPAGRSTPILFYVGMGLSTWVRLDMAAMSVTLLVAMAILDGRNRRQHILMGGSVLVASVLIQTALRYAYFGELLPNTYYLKMTGMPLVDRLSRGASVFIDFVRGMGWPVFLFPFASLIWTRDRRISLVAGLFVTQCLYSVYVGGDAWEWWGGSNRYIAIVMPLFFILYASALMRLRVACGHMLAWRSSMGRMALRLGICFLLVLSHFQVNTCGGSVGLSAWVDGGSFLASWALGRQSGADPSEVGNVVRWLAIPRPLELLENPPMVRAAALLDSITFPGARIAVFAAGVLPYFSDRAFVDLLGKNDKSVARMKSKVAIDPKGMVRFTPGHSKWDYGYSIGSQKPDVVFQLWASQEEARPILEADYCAQIMLERPRYFRRDSRLIRWDVLAREVDTSPGGRAAGK